MKRIIKRIVLITCALMMFLSFASCGDKDSHTKEFNEEEGKIATDLTQLTENEVYEEFMYLLENEEIREKTIGKKIKMRGELEYEPIAAAWAELGESYSPYISFKNGQSLRLIHFDIDGRTVLKFEEIEKLFGFESFYQPITIEVEGELQFQPIDYGTINKFILINSVYKIVK